MWLPRTLMKALLAYILICKSITRYTNMQKSAKTIHLQKIWPKRSTSCLSVVLVCKAIEVLTANYALQTWIEKAAEIRTYKGFFVREVNEVVKDTFVLQDWPRYTYVWRAQVHCVLHKAVTLYHVLLQVQGEATKSKHETKCNYGNCFSALCKMWEKRFPVEISATAPWKVNYKQGFTSTKAHGTVFLPHAS